MNSTGCCSASASSQATKASRVFCFCRCGRQVEGRIALRQRQREQRGQERHHLGQRRGDDAPEPSSSLLQLLCGRRLVRRQARAAADARSRDTGRCAGDRANSDTPCAYARSLRHAAPCSTCTRRDLPIPASPLSSTTCPCPPWLCSQRRRSNPLPAPAPPAASALGQPPPPGGSAPHSPPAPDRPAAASATPLRACGPEVVTGKIALDQALRRLADHHRIGRRQPLSRPQYWACPPGPTVPADRCHPSHPPPPARYGCRGVPPGGCLLSCSRRVFNVLAWPRESQSPPAPPAGHRLHGPGDSQSRPAGHRRDTGQYGPSKRWITSAQVA